jgi:hypothetical protein
MIYSLAGAELSRWKRNIYLYITGCGELDESYWSFKKLFMSLSIRKSDNMRVRGSYLSVRKLMSLPNISRALGMS